MALCVIKRSPEAAPAAAGEKLTVTNIDWPGVKVNGPPPLTTENGAARAPTLPVNAAVEPGSLVMVTVWFWDCPTVTFPKFKLAAVTEMLGPVVTPFPFKGMLVGLG